MAPTLGKRKRITRERLEQSSRSSSASRSASEQSDGEDIQNIFQRAFEAKFKPLGVEPKKRKIEEVVENEEDLEEESDWSGINSEEDNVEVVEYSNGRNTGEKASRTEMKAFMSSKPPTSQSQTRSLATKAKPAEDEDDATETTHLKNDLALQRLLRDSHLLSSTSTSGSNTPTLNATGAQRHKSTDLHLLSLGAKSSIHTQKNMPMSHRKGIAAKNKQREERRRAEARENGVILEKAIKVKRFTKERERGVGGPGVGKFRGGTLTLSKRDVADITGGGGEKGRSKGKKGRR
ncbi:hypothetical protein K469DRAFT_698242 [Zopfia rhizophila CBS 207.26]|uniref:Uncharacterized protein n=1 Tax=Zopfia rhizophila CBS 207.26 TaxID=1314779 RepID=A0A6A6DFN4_9PEZI|nr:hypothetical protein K469DRAFT_698242 [Zopfia rhizophila CBS 207.26]